MVYILKYSKKVVKAPRKKLILLKSRNWIDMHIKQVCNLRMWTYIDTWPKYFANQLDQICYFNWWVSNLNKPTKYVKQMRKCFFHNMINWCSLLIWFEPAKTINNQDMCMKDIVSYASVNAGDRAHTEGCYFHRSQHSHIPV